MIRFRWRFPWRLILPRWIEPPRVGSLSSQHQIMADEMRRVAVFGVWIGDTFVGVVKGYRE